MDASRAIDRTIWIVGAIGILVAVMAGVAMATRSPAPAGAADQGAEAARPHMTFTEFALEGDLVVPPGEVVFELHNEGGVTHNLSIEGVGTSPDVAGGSSAEWEAGTLAAGTYEVFCAIPGHKEAGMRETLVVSADADAADLGAAHGHGEEPDWEALDEAMMNSILAFPAETEGRGNQLLEPTVLADGTKEYRLTAAITPWEVEPGRVVDAWSYNGMVPGPMIRLDLGDKVRVVLDNQLPMGTDIHWHGIHTPNSMDGVAPITQPLVRSGETFVYEFEATHLAVGMYHAHHHAQMQVPNGLFAPMLIGELPLPAGRTISGIAIPEDIEIAQEIPMVLNDAGVIGFSLNGKSFPATDPYVVTAGDWIMVHYYNEGLQIHPMHQHQFPQLVVAKDGIPLESPYWADTVNVAPGERYTVLLNPTDPGVWVWHCHILNHVEREEGMFGMVTALIVQES